MAAETGENNVARDPVEDAIGPGERKLLATLERCSARSRWRGARISVASVYVARGDNGSIQLGNPLAVIGCLPDCGGPNVTLEGNQRKRSVKPQLVDRLGAVRAGGLEDGRRKSEPTLLKDSREGRRSPKASSQGSN